MTKKRALIIALIIVALLLASIALTAYFNESKNKISTNKNNGGQTEEDGNGKVGVVILPPDIEDKNNGN